MAPTWDPWAKWVEVQQYLIAAVKGTQNAPKNPMSEMQLGSET